MSERVRRADRQITDRREGLQIVEKARVLRLGLFDGDYPYIVPLHFGFDYDGALDRYVFFAHGAASGHKLDLIRQNPRVCVELENETELVSGGDVACRYGARYASFIGRGTAFIEEDASQKRHGLARLMAHQTGKEFAFSEQALASVAVIRVEISRYTCKARRQ